MNAKRKPLNEQFEAFVREGKAPEDKPEPAAEALSSTPETTLEPVKPTAGRKKPVKENNSLLDRLTVGEPDDLKPITLNLPLSMHRKLKALSGKTGRNKSEIIRFALESLFQELEE